jgi:hypothetical protein
VKGRWDALATKVRGVAQSILQLSGIGSSYRRDAGFETLPSSALFRYILIKEGVDIVN